MRPSRSIVLVVVAAAGCGSPSPPVAPAPASSSAAVAPAQPPTREVDLSPVPEPAHLFATARWRGPLDDADALLRMMKAGVTVAELAKREADQDLLQLIKSDGTIDIALALAPTATLDNPDVMVAVSVPLRSLDDALARFKREGRAVDETRAGVFRVTKKNPCDVATAVDGPRLVCAERARWLDALSPYLTRTLARTQAEPGLHASVRAKPLRDRFAPELRVEAAKMEDEAVEKLKREGVSDPELLGALAAVLDDSFKLADDLERLELSASLDEKQRRVVASGALVFASSSAWLTQLALSPSKRSGPVPPTFYKLPKESYAATFAEGVDPAMLAGPTRVVKKMIEEIVVRAKLDKGDADAIRKLVDAWPPSSTVSVAARGVPAGKLPKLGPTSRSADIDRYGKGMITRVMGWSIVGVDAPSDAYVTWFRRLRDGYQRGLASLGKKSKSPRERQNLAKAPALRVVESPPGYPRGSVALDLVVRYPGEFNDELAEKLVRRAEPPPGRPAPKAASNRMSEVTARLVATPDGKTTWLGFSLDPTELGRLVSSTVKGAPDATLAGVRDLDGLRRDALTTGGFFRAPTDSLDELLELAEAQASSGDAKDVAGVRALVSSLPNRGRTPLLFFGTTRASGPPSLAFSFEVQPGTFDDLATVGAFFVGPGRHLLKKRAPPEVSP